MAERERIEEEWDEGATAERSSRWTGALTTMGVALVAVVAGQVIASIVEGLVISGARQEPTGVPTDLLHRLGFPFGNVGPQATVMLIIGVALLTVPLLLGRKTTALQDRLIGIALTAVVVLAVVVALGSILAVRNSLHEYTARNQNPPAFARIGFAMYLLGSLGGAAIAIFGSLTARNLRRPPR